MSADEEEERRSIVRERLRGTKDEEKEENKTAGWDYERRDKIAFKRRQTVIKYHCINCLVNQKKNVRDGQKKEEEKS